MTAPAVYVGLQRGFGPVPDMRLYNLTEAIPGHPKGSMVSAATLKALGYEIPREEEFCTECDGTMLRHTPGCRWPE